jgi:hypothetical protein
VLAVVAVMVVMVLVFVVGGARRQDGAGLAGDGKLADAEGLGALGLRGDQGREEQEEHGGSKHRDDASHHYRSWLASTV